MGAGTPHTRLVAHLVGVVELVVVVARVAVVVGDAVAAVAEMRKNREKKTLSIVCYCMQILFNLERT